MKQLFSVGLVCQAAIGLVLAVLPLRAVRAQSFLRPDAGFGTNGSVSTGLTGRGGIFYQTDPAQIRTNFSQGQLLRANNRLYVCGGGPGGFVVKRYLLDGSPDAGFGTNGVVTTDFPQAPYPQAAEARGLALQPDGKLVVVGYISGQISRALAAVRYEQNGALDLNFGDYGRTHNIPGSSPELELKRAVVLADGSSLAYATAPGRSNSTTLVRILPDGYLDATFNGTSPYLVLNDYIQNMVGLPDGRVLLVGSSLPAAQPSGRTPAVVYRLTATGTLDSGFGTNGRALIGGTQLYMGATVDAFTEIYGAAVQADGKILLAGLVHYDASTSAGNMPALLRLNTNGTPDAAFNTAANRTIITTGGLQAVAVQPDGDIVVGGNDNNASGTMQVLLARYTPAGALATNGTYRQSLPSGQATVSDLALQSDGTLYTLGGYEPGTGGNADGLRLARYAPAMASATRPADAALLQLRAAPVPTAGPVQLRYTLPRPAPVRVVLRDQLGRAVASPLRAAQQAAGQQELNFTVESLAAGIYFCTLEAGTFHQTVRLAVMR